MHEDGSTEDTKAGIPAGCNPSDVLYKLAHTRGIKPPVFEMISEQGPPHARTYTWSCSFWDGRYQTMAAGRSKKEAKNAVAKALLDQIDLSVLPTKASFNPNKQNREKMKKRKATEDNPMQGQWGPPHPPMPAKFRFQQMGGRFPPHMMRPRNTKEDHQVILKHRNIYPTQDELGVILKLAETTERALKRVSDKFVTPVAEVKKEVKKEEGEDENAVKNGGDGNNKDNREILGVARTGDLAKGLLLTGDRQVDLVVMCKEKPTLTLLNKVKEALKEEVKAIPENEKKGKIVINDGELEVTTQPREAAIFIKYKKEEDLFTVTITLTSTKLRISKEENGTATEGDEVVVKKEKEEEKDPHDILPKEKCLYALAELRRSKWFSTMAVPIESCVESIRIFREVCRRVEAWKPLSRWAVELLVERAVSTAETPLSPSLALSRVLEVVAGGALAKAGPGLKDPCEREEQDVTDNLTPQQSEDLQVSAQEFLRKLHFRKIHEVLDLPQLPPRKKSGAGAEPAVKKQKTDAE